MFRTKLVTLTVGIVVVTLASQTQANPITFAGTGLTTDVVVRHDGSDEYVRAGEIFVDYNATRFTAYCVDLDHWMKNKWDATPTPVTGVENGLAAAFLYDTFAGTVKTGVQAAALQIAIWKVVEDPGNSLNLNSGSFRFSGSKDVVDATLGFLTALPKKLKDYTTKSYILSSGTDPRSQNLIVPEPASLVLLASALPVLLIGRRR
jgi:hypothetical protein